MAVAATAETYYHEPIVYEAEPPYRFVDAIPEVAREREIVRRAAQALLEQRKLNSHQGHELDYVPVDALSTAHEALRAIHMFGEGSAEHGERGAALRLDCQRLIAEWYRKKKPEYFPSASHKFDTDKQEFFSHGLSIRQMTENALVPIKDNPEEENRRINERVEDATPQILRKLGKIALDQESILTLSECTDKAIADYTRDMRAGKSHRGYDGYVPEIEKVMVRVIRLDSGSLDRYEEQVGLPGTYITHDVIQEVLTRQGADARRMDKTTLHGAQLLTKGNLMDFVRSLDEVASDWWCTNIFMGEEVPEGFVKDYANFRQEALQRQAALRDQVDTTANFVLDLAEDDVDRSIAPGMVEDFVKKILLDVAKQDNTVAEQMFDTNTAAGLQEVGRLERLGRYDEAFQLWQTVEQAAPGGGYCGGGSCGLESVSTNSDEGKELADKLRAKAGDTIVKDKERACKCGSKSIVYAYNKNKVNKYCQNCQAFESKASKAA